ncbi:MAG TPA: efflux RND transporter permease subunit, partial [Acidobacteriota bacterium]|nr:efflux RND transporter permease subunit [Acidobacteriota bacterium]
ERSSIPIRLGSVARIEESRGPAEIRRIHSQRAAIVSANLSGRDLGSVSEEINRELDELRLQAGDAVSMGLGGQNDELQASYTSLGFALVLAIILVYLVMASQFESLVHPFIVMFTVPLGVIGVIFALYLTGTTISVMVLLGTIILVGIVVNNAILLVDYTNQLRQSGLARREALVQAGVVRLRPILMTTLTTVLGLIPMALGWGDGAEVRTPMAIAVMGGLTFCTALTLIFVPVVYEVLDRRHYATDLVAGTPEPAAGLQLSEAERSGS